MPSASFGRPCFVPLQFAPLPFNINLMLERLVEAEETVSCRERPARDRRLLDDRMQMQMQGRVLLAATSTGVLAR